MNVDNIDHPHMVSVLAKPGADILSTFTPARTHIVHMLLGIVGECGELADGFCNYRSILEHGPMGLLPVVEDNILEELGDTEFYLEGLAQIYGTSGQAVHNQAMEEWIDTGRNKRVVIEELQIHVGNLVDVIKKMLIYNKPFDKEHEVLVRDKMACVARQFIPIYHELGITRDEALTGNKLKLAKRYENFEYSDQAAHKRADKPEGE